MKTSLITRHPAEPVAMWFPPAPSREQTPLLVALPTSAEDKALAETQQEIARLKTIIAKQQNALDYYRNKSAKPMRDMDTLTWFRRALIGNANVNPMPVIDTLEDEVWQVVQTTTRPALRA
jgi:hypothetical protein